MSYKVVISPYKAVSRKASSKNDTRAGSRNKTKASCKIATRSAVKVTSSPAAKITLRIAVEKNSMASSKNHT